MSTKEIAAHMQSSKTKPRTWLIAALAALVTIPLTGCNPCAPRINWKKICEKPVLCYRDTVWARRAYNLRYGNCNRKYGAHFEQGFIDGYCNVCQGGDGYVPAIPPDNYMDYEYQCAEGSKCVNAWFEGYPAGAKAARADGSGAYNDIYISKMVDTAVSQENANHVLPSDVPIKSNSAPSQIPVDVSSTPSMIESSFIPGAGMHDPSVSMPLPTGIQPAGFESGQN